MFSAYTRRMAKLKKLKIPAETYITLISSQRDLVLAFVNFIHRASSGFMICLETDHLKEQKCYFLSTDCKEKNGTANLFLNALRYLYSPLITQYFV